MFKDSYLLPMLTQLTFLYYTLSITATSRLNFCFLVLSVWLVHEAIDLIRKERELCFMV